MEDRGTKKWTSLMLPEHIKALKDMWAEDQWKEKPMLDEQMIVEMNLKLQLAMNEDLTVEIEYFRDHDYHKTRGKLLGVDPLLNYLRLEDLEIPLDSLVSVWID